MTLSNTAGKVVILGTGGTIAGQASRASDNVGYTAAQLSVADLVAAVPSLDPSAVEHEQVAQVDSKDMVFSIWKQLARRILHHAARPEIAGIVVTHGTDTLEETAWFLHLVLQTRKPVVLTCAMRPATALTPDGPQNLGDAVVVARDERVQGVVAVCAGLVHAAEHVTKRHTYRTNAFDSGDAGPVGVVEEGAYRPFWTPVVPGHDPTLWERVSGADALPRVEVLLSHADAGGAMVRCLIRDPGHCGDPLLRGLVIAGTGNGTIHHQMLQALEEAMARGVVVWRGTRCPNGQVVTGPADGAGVAMPSAVKARISLALALLEMTPPAKNPA